MEKSSPRKRQVVAGGSLGHGFWRAPAGEVSAVDATPTSPDMGTAAVEGEAQEWNRTRVSWLSVEAPGTQR